MLNMGCHPLAVSANWMACEAFQRQVFLQLKKPCAIRCTSVVWVIFLRVVVTRGSTCSRIENASTPTHWQRQSVQGPWYREAQTGISICLWIHIVLNRSWMFLDRLIVKLCLPQCLP